MIANEPTLGCGSGPAHNTRIGTRLGIQTLTLIGPWTYIEEEVLVAPGATFVGDPPMGRCPADAASPGILTGRAARVGAGAIVFRDVEVG